MSILPGTHFGRRLAPGRVPGAHPYTSPVPPTAHPAVDGLLDELVDGIRTALGPTLIGLYLGGSLAIDDFEPAVSDVDLLALLASDVDDAAYARLERMHREIAARRPDWDGRIEVRYASTAAIASTRSPAPGEIVSISPGEPFHRRRLQVEWLIEWYLLREKSIALVGPPASTIVAPISRDEFVGNVVAHADSWLAWVHTMRHRKGQAYAILCMCRALYAVRHGDQTSKRRAARWAQRELPEWAPLIADALAWRAARDETGVDHAATVPETVRFVHAVRERIRECRPT